MSDDAQTPIEGFCIIELFGHQKCAGYVTTAIVGTSAMLRVDVPAIENASPYTRFYGPGAIYSLTLVTEDVMLAALRTIRPRVVTVYSPRQLEAFKGDDEEDYEDGSFGYQREQGG